MGDFFLTVDLGNSAAKLRVWSERLDAAPECIARLDWDASEAPSSARLEELLAGRTFSCAGISSVASNERAADWRALLQGAAIAHVLEDPGSGLENRTREPGQVGRDRLYAARGAWELAGESAVVVDAGTAVTVDALLVEGGAGVFLGGAIAPGPALLARALAQGAARLFTVEPAANPPALGRDSAQAMRAGIGVGLRGAVRELAAEVAREAGLGSPPIVLTGGARAFVASAFPGQRLIESEDLVHIGLVAALLERAGKRVPASSWSAR